MLMYSVDLKLKKGKWMFTVFGCNNWNEEYKGEKLPKMVVMDQCSDFCMCSQHLSVSVCSFPFSQCVFTRLSVHSVLLNKRLTIHYSGSAIIRLILWLQSKPKQTLLNLLMQREEKSVRRLEKT